MKGLPFDTVSIDLRSGANRQPEWLARNPQGLVPALELDDGTFLTQSLAILEWLDERWPEPAFLPADPLSRAKVRAAALVIAADVHPIQNSGILKRVEQLAGPEAATLWAADIIGQGLASFEQLIADEPGPYCFGEQPGLADILLVPMLGNARRHGAAIDHLKRIGEVEAACRPLPAFRAAVPEGQPDAPARQ